MNRVIPAIAMMVIMCGCSPLKGMDVPTTSSPISHQSLTHCSQCHHQPSEHIIAPTTCSDCHKEPGVRWSFSHSQVITCSQCHVKDQTAIAVHTVLSGVDCSSCHFSPGSTWADGQMDHSLAATCDACHEAPTPPGLIRHASGWGGMIMHPGGGNCFSCHTWGIGPLSWDQSAQCEQCH